MKTIKFALLAFLLGCSIYSLNAQLKVHPNGVVNMGNPASPALTVNPDGTINIGKTEPQIEINPDNNLFGTIRIGETTEPLLDDYTYFDVNIPITREAVIRQTIGINMWDNPIIVGFRFLPSVDNINSYLGPATSVMALTGLYNNGASIGTEYNSINVVYSSYYYSGGQFIGTLASSDFKLKTNIRKLSPISEKILKLNPVTYDFVKSGSKEDVSKNASYKDRTGFIAQEVKEIFPDLVVMGGDSLYRLDYAGLIPYLTKALQEQVQTIQKQDELMLAQERINKEQSETIEKLQSQINDIQKGVYTADFIIEGETSQPNKSPQTSGADNTLYQNAPNPFNISTTIKYQLSDNVTNAKICIYNLTGKQLQCYNLQATKGENSIEVRASSLQAGMYLYSLIVDDKLIVTKRMILTE